MCIRDSEVGVVALAGERCRVSPGEGHDVVMALAVDDGEDFPAQGSRLVGGDGVDCGDCESLHLLLRLLGGAFGLPVGLGDDAVLDSQRAAPVVCRPFRALDLLDGPLCLLVVVLDGGALALGQLGFCLLYTSTSARSWWNGSRAGTR